MTNKRNTHSIAEKKAMYQTAVGTIVDPHTPKNAQNRSV
jgi:hypothetical protein